MRHARPLYRSLRCRSFSDQLHQGRFVPQSPRGTVLELGFEWLNGGVLPRFRRPQRAYCGRRSGWTARRVSLDLPDPESVGFDTEDPHHPRDPNPSPSATCTIRPAQSVHLFLKAGNGDPRMECWLEVPRRGFARSRLPEHLARRGARPSGHLRATFRMRGVDSPIRVGPSRPIPACCPPFPTSAFRPPPRRHHFPRLRDAH